MVWTSSLLYTLPGQAPWLLSPMPAAAWFCCPLPLPACACGSPHACLPPTLPSHTHTTTHTTNPPPFRPHMRRCIGGRLPRTRAGTGRAAWYFDALFYHMPPPSLTFRPFFLHYCLSSCCLEQDTRAHLTPSHGFALDVNRSALPAGTGRWWLLSSWHWHNCAELWGGKPRRHSWRPWTASRCSFPEQRAGRAAGTTGYSAAHGRTFATAALRTPCCSCRHGLLRYKRGAPHTHDSQTPTGSSHLRCSPPSTVCWRFSLCAC